MSQVEERVPGKQGLKLKRYDTDETFFYRRRASSRKTRIETEIRIVDPDEAEDVEERVPGKQGLKLARYSHNYRCQSCRRASSRKTRIET